MLSPFLFKFWMHFKFSGVCSHSYNSEWYASVIRLRRLPDGASRKALTGGGGLALQRAQCIIKLHLFKWNRHITTQTNKNCGKNSSKTDSPISKNQHMLKTKSQIHGKRNLINGVQRQKRERNLINGMQSGKEIRGIHTTILMVLSLGDDIKSNFHLLLLEYLDFFFEQTYNHYYNRENSVRLFLYK